ncbi:MAG TPA: cytochrome c3 family protein [Polyangiales bacterium]|nr:cytochrome c3 family protein [Polyangiales bacterium]
MQIFPRSLNYLPLVAAVGVAVLGGGLTLGIWYYFSPRNLQVGYAPEQPIPYSHKLHAGELGIDCRYCHANIERSQEAMIPPTQACMGCHAIVKKDSPKLAALRASWSTGAPVEWVRVHRVADFVFFDHSVHLAAGVGCVTCHGRVDQMEVVRQDQPLNMGWCLECHRDPKPNLRPKDQITNMTWTPSDEERTQLAEATIRGPEHCSGCHR